MNLQAAMDGFRAEFIAIMERATPALKGGDPLGLFNFR